MNTTQFLVRSAIDLGIPIGPLTKVVRVTLVPCLV
eukprot:SAG31_NODE_8115_length_1520_cov_2.018297_1_plen_34_part_01